MGASTSRPSLEGLTEDEQSVVRAIVQLGGNQILLSSISDSVGQEGKVVEQMLKTLVRQSVLVCDSGDGIPNPYFSLTPTWSCHLLSDRSTLRGITKEDLSGWSGI